MPKSKGRVRAGIEIRRETLSAQVVHFLRDAIITGKFAEGERLIESELSAMTGASYTPIREALLTLEAEGLVTIAPHRGACVSTMSEEELTELYAIRASLESLAARSAAPFITSKDLRELDRLVRESLTLMEGKQYEEAFRAAHAFHEIYLAKSPFGHLLRILRSLTSQLQRYSFASIQQNPDRLRRIAREHQQIVKALRGRNPADIETTVNLHILRGGAEARTVSPRREASMGAARLSG